MEKHVPVCVCMSENVIYRLYIYLVYVKLFQYVFVCIFKSVSFGYKKIYMTKRNLWLGTTHTHSGNTQILYVTNWTKTQHVSTKQQQKSHPKTASFPFCFTFDAVWAVEVAEVVYLRCNRALSTRNAWNIPCLRNFAERLGCCRRLHVGSRWLPFLGVPLTRPRCRRRRVACRVDLGRPLRNPVNVRERKWGKMMVSKGEFNIIKFRCVVCNVGNNL